MSDLAIRINAVNIQVWQKNTRFYLTVIEFNGRKFKCLNLIHWILTGKIILWNTSNVGCEWLKILSTT